MKVKQFCDVEGKVFTIKSRKSAIYIYEGSEERLEFYDGQNRVFFWLDLALLESVFDYLYSQAKESWVDISLKDVTSFGNDYGEYYDKELGNDGGISISAKGLMFSRVGAHLEGNPSRLFKFNKAKIQTFLYDLKNVIEKERN